MCLKYVKIDASHPCGIRHAFVPCGNCVDCRRKLSQAWSFRINSEFLALKKKGWNCAFATLTYRPKDLPHISEICFKNVDEYREIPCFDRAQVRKWIDDVRQHCKYHYRFVKDKKTGEDNRIRYFIATELGSLRHRPHMHVILAWPPSVDYKTMHEICTKFWHYGYLFPRDYRGDKKMLSFEIVGDASKVFTYVSKYVCKDLELEKLIGKTEFYSERKKYEENSYEMLANDCWRNCQSFHIQSQSLGFEAIKNLDDDAKIRVYQHGLYFSADANAKPQQVPVYIKHKLVFEPYYVYDEDGKRLVRRKASAFFLAHAHEIFDGKAEFYQKYLRNSETVGYYVNRGLDEELAKKLVEKISFYAKHANDAFPDLDKDNKLGKMYLAYRGVNSSYRYDTELCNQWLFRYYPDATFKPHFNNDSFDYDLAWLDSYWECVDNANSLLGSIGAPERENDEAKIKRVLDFFNNIIK